MIDKTSQQIDDERKFELFKNRTMQSYEGEKMMFQSVMDSGTQTLKSAFLINGGSTLALLALLGNLSATNPLLLHKYFLANSATAALVFSLGTGLASVAMGIRYLTQYLYSSSYSGMLVHEYRMDEEQHKEYSAKFDQSRSWLEYGKKLNLVSILLTSASLMAFFWGVYVFSCSFQIKYF